MKAKIFLSAAVMAGFLASCSDELESVSMQNLDSNLKNRPLAGKVVFNTGDTRFDAYTGKAEDGDKLGLYLMDEFSGRYYGNYSHANDQYGYGEKDNANLTLWKHQTNWYAMYNMVNYIQTNYPYTFNPSKGWVNSAAQLVEGNYILMFPAQDKATNRRDLWRWINPEVVLENKSEIFGYKGQTEIYANMDNQFKLDYKQIYRDEDGVDEGELTMQASLKNVLSNGRVVIANKSSDAYKIKSIAVRRHSGEAVPTLAYVRPGAPSNYGYNVDGSLGSIIDQIPEATQDEALMAEMMGLYRGLGWYYANALIGRGNTDKFTQVEAENLTDPTKHEDDQYIVNNLFKEKDYLYTNGAKAFTQADARRIVFFEAPIQHIPYGCTDEQAEVAYEYKFIFPEGGKLLEGHDKSATGAQRVDALITLPYFMDDPEMWDDMEIVVYADKWDITKGTDGEWVSGVLAYKDTYDSDNNKWSLNKIFSKPSIDGVQTPYGTVEFDNYFFTETPDYQVVVGQAEFEEAIDAIAQKVAQSKGAGDDVYGYITLRGGDFKMTKAMAEKIKGARMVYINSYNENSRLVAVEDGALASNMMLNDAYVVLKSNTTVSFPLNTKKTIIERGDAVTVNLAGSLNLNDVKNISDVLKFPVLNNVLNEGTLTITGQGFMTGYNENCVEGVMNIAQGATLLVFPTTGAGSYNYGHTLMNDNIINVEGDLRNNIAGQKATESEKRAIACNPNYPGGQPQINVKSTGKLTYYGGGILNITEASAIQHHITVYDMQAENPNPSSTIVEFTNTSNQLSNCGVPGHNDGAKEKVEAIMNPNDLSKAKAINIYMTGATFCGSWPLATVYLTVKSNKLEATPAADKYKKLFVEFDVEGNLTAEETFTIENLELAEGQNLIISNNKTLTIKNLVLNKNSKIIGANNSTLIVDNVTVNGDGYAYIYMTETNVTVPANDQIKYQG